jgi:N4-gp56 family major capsid protein
MTVLRKADITSQIPQLWSSDLFSQAEDLTFWGRFEGPEGSSMPIIRKNDLEKVAGDTVKFDIALALTGTGSTGDTALLDGNEEKMKLRQATVSVDSLQHALRWSKLEKILQSHDTRVIAQNQLRKWLAGVLDNRIFAELTGETIGGYIPGTVVASLPTTMKWFAGTATSVATVDNTDSAGRLKLGDISDFKAYLQVTNKVEPLRLANGEEIFGMVCHPYSMLALKKDSQFQQAQREAAARGADNPLFSGAVGMWDGVVLYVSNRVPTALDGVSSAAVARNVFFGAQAGMRAYCWYPDWVEQSFSYGQESGIACFVILGHRVIYFDLTSGGGAATTAQTAIGSGILYANATAPTA